MNARQQKYSLYSTAYVVVILAVLGIGNYLANKNNKTYDTTSNKRYSLSDQTVSPVPSPLTSEATTKAAMLASIAAEAR